MPTTRTEYSAAFEFPDVIQKDLGATITCPLYRGKNLIAPSAATTTIRKPDGTVFATGAATITSSIARYAVSSASIVDVPLEMGWRSEWACTISGVVYSFRNELGFARFAPASPVHHGDLVRRHSDIPVWIAGMENDEGDDEPSTQRWIDEAWAQCQRWLIAKGNRPHLIVQSTDIKDLMIIWSLWVMLNDLGTSATVDDRIYTLRDEYREELRAMRDSLHFEYSSTDGETPDVDRRAGTPAVFFGVAGHTSYWQGR